MKTKKNMAAWVLSSIIATATFTACSDELAETGNGNTPLTDNTEGGSLSALEQYSYAVPYEVKAQGKWKISFQFNEGHEICYALPSEGEGPATVKICVLDNWTDEQRTGVMTVTDMATGKSTSVDLRQKCNTDYGTRAGNLVTPEKGNIIYGVGYGYNIYKPLSKAITLNPILRVEEFKDTKVDVFVTEGVDAKFEYQQYTGSTLKEISSDFKAKASATGKGFGFEGEVGATFNMKNTSSSSHEYAISTVSITKTNAALIGMDKSTLSNYYMCNEAYANINGLPFQMNSEDIPEGAPVRRGRGAVVAYPSTDEGFFNLVKQYGTHLIIRTRMGGRLSYATSIDVSKVEDSYDLNAYAKLSYKCSWASASGEVSEDYKQSFKKNSSAINTTLTAYGGDGATVTSIAISGTEENINKWKESLDNITNQKVVGVDKETLIPIYELCVDKTREAAMKDYIENRLVLDMAREESEELARSGYQSSTVAHIGSLPSFESESENGTLIKDIYMGGQHVARVCNEYIPCLNKQQRVSVIYPVAGNKVKYNLGYWPGNDSHKPCRVCFNDTMSVVKEISSQKAGGSKDLYICGSSVYTKESDADLLSGETVAETKVRNAYMEGKGNSNKNGEQVYNYPIVKIFNHIWTREHYCQRIYDDQVVRTGGYDAGWYSPGQVKYFNLNNWHMAKVSDFKNLKDGITKAGFNLTASTMYNNPAMGATDLTGFNIEWMGWWDYSRNRNAVCNGNNNDQMEYMTINDKNQFGHIRLTKQGSMEIEDNNFNTNNWFMAVKLVQDLK